ncbi:MAG: hypothetical protein WC859_03590 [Elusimicrobiota bacterium]|jgi:two-component system phosphate regulon sensor histidine kinase PhoR
MNLSYTKKLTLSYLFVVVVTLVFTAAFLTHRLQKTFLKQLEQSLAAQATLIAKPLPSLETISKPVDHFQPSIQQLGHQMQMRITLIRKDGQVIADSERTRKELPQMDNHLSRPEVRTAMVSGIGESMRYSATLHEDMLYVAVPIGPTATPSGVLRVALPLTEVHHRVQQIQKDILVAGVAALAAAWLVALVSVRRISRPLRQLIEVAKAIGRGHY